MDKNNFNLPIDLNPFVINKNIFLNNYLSNNNKFINRINMINIEPYRQLNYSISQLIDIPKLFEDKIIFYWGSDELSDNNLNIINDFEISHQKLNNYGLTKVNKKQRIKIYLKIPQIYYINNNFNENKVELLVPRIVNLIFYNEENNKWDFDQIYSLLIFPKLRIEKFIDRYKTKNTIIINTNNNFIYSTNHLANTFNLSSENINTYEDIKLEDWFQKIIKNNYPKLSNYSNNINLVPIILYSNNRLKQEKYINLCYNFLKRGFLNISFFYGDIIDFIKHTDHKYDKTLKKKKKKIYNPTFKKF